MGLLRATTKCAFKYDAWLLDGVRRKIGNAELRLPFTADVLPKIDAIEISSLTKHDLRCVLRALVDRAVNRAAIMLRTRLTQMFGWAEKRQPWRRLLVDGDPMDLIEFEKIISALRLLQRSAEPRAARG